MPTEPIESCGAASAEAAPRYHGYRFYKFRIWYGMLASAWLGLLVRNRFAVSPSRLPFALFGLLISAVNSIFNLAENLILARRIRACVIEEPPIFIIGHWRTGTTFLHELLTLDERFTAPSTLECFAPAECLLIRGLLRTLFKFALPAKRPMDNVLVGWDRPQEDDFALMNLGLRSPYEVIVFPNHRRARHPFLNMTDLGPGQIEEWKAGFLSFLQKINLRSKYEQTDSKTQQRIVLKSPYHTARLHILRQMFPAAKFIHIVRNPFEVFSSSIRLWRALFDTQGCQKPEFGALSEDVPDLEQYVFDGMDLLYRDFFTQIAEIPVQNFCQVRYEDLVRAPVDEMARLYTQLQLGSFETVRPRLEAHVRELDGYKTNKHHISPHQRAQIDQRWGWYMDRFGYRVPSAQARSDGF